MLEQYNAIYTENKEISYDTEQFKYICELMKNNDPDTKESLHTFVEDYYNQEMYLKWHMRGSRSDE